jgi:ppGpp synthetase/RelA/SpoT-type nucleotidyltranferase
VRLISSSPPPADDLAALHELLEDYGDALEEAVAIVHDRTSITPTSRVKNTGTILEKLDRYGGSWLKSIQDIAGMRIVASPDRDHQDELVGQLTELFTRGRSSPRVVDRREQPMHGYTAVHVIPVVRDVPIEIQVRTRLQHEWADLFEKLADRMGRGIRYGEPPAHWKSTHERKALPPDRRKQYDLRYALRCDAVALAKDIGGQLRLHEQIAQRFPDDEEIARRREHIARYLARFGALLHRL